MAEALPPVPDESDVLRLRPFTDCVDQMFDMLHARDNLITEIIPAGKDNEVSEEFCDKAETEFRNTKCLLSIKHFSEAISYAVNNTPQMGKAYMGRGVALIEEGFKSQGLQQLDAALQCPIDSDEALDTIRRYRRIANANIPQRHLEYDYPRSQGWFKPFEESRRNETIQCASNDVKIIDVPEGGRKVVAARDIALNEVIAIEDPYISCLYPEEEMYYCVECLTPCLWLIPCPNCTGIMFCSTNCRDTAFNKYHRFECGLLKAIKDTISEEILMAVRVVFSNMEILENPGAFVAEDNTYRSDRLWEILNLYNHPDQKPTTSGRYASEAAKVFHIFNTHSAPFQNLTDDGKQIFKGLVMKLAVISHLRRTEIANTVREKDQWIEANHRYVAQGLYPFIGLINHSCAPNVNKQSMGKTMFARAIKDIEKGSEIFTHHEDCYYVTTSRLDRQDKLWEHYEFECSCEACEGSWPMLNDVSESAPDTSMRRDLDDICNVLSTPLTILNLEDKCDTIAWLLIMYIEGRLANDYERMLFEYNFMLAYIRLLDPVVIN